MLDDIDLTFQFLNKDRSLILVHYPELKYQEEYYRYHFENLYIRLASILDLIAKIGNDIYNLDIKSKNVSAYIFKDVANKKGFKSISLITENLIVQIEKFKKARHSKLHSGESKFDLLDNIVIWEDLLNFSDSETDPILKKNTDEEIAEKIQEYNNETIEVVKTIRHFLNESTKQLMLVINSKGIQL